MAEIISLAEAASNLPKLENEIRKGGVLVLPMEGSYIYLADAFNLTAVQKIHELRGDDSGTSCAVALGKSETLNGITSALTKELSLLIQKYWPGPLTLLVPPNPALSWDLGDHGDLGEFAVRIPNSIIIQDLAKNIGPLAFASAAHSGRGAARDLSEVSAIGDEIAIYIDGGKLEESMPSTVVRVKIIGVGGVEVLRVGGISLTELRDLIPEISAVDGE